MLQALHHRGPDDAGVETVREDGIALGMRRLSILDIAGGHQPMWNSGMRAMVVFNGEIYNWTELRCELQSRGHIFRTSRSDTEVLLHGYQEWGEDLCQHLDGMFAFAIWDRGRQQMFVGRDRTGEKPFYLAKLPQGYAFASELKALLAHPGVDRTIDPVALEQYLSFDFVLSPRSIFKGIRKLPAGHVALLNAESMTEHRYWHLNFSSSDRGEGELIAELDSLLDVSVKERMIADVPVGLLLSGGLDSSTVGYYMSRHSPHVRSFSIGFEESGYDESHFARVVADHLGLNHHLEIFSQDRVKEWIPRIPEILDEPMADQSILPTALLCLTTRKGVKVALGGDGSDELLMGYKTYKAMAIADRIDVLPASLRRGLAVAARAMLDDGAGARFRGLRFASRLDQSPARRLLSHLGALGGSGGSVLMSPSDPSEFWAEAEVSLGSGPEHWSPAERTMSAYVKGYLQEDILVKVDRASMAASLEVRAPFLDTSLVEFLATVPAQLKLRGMKGKYILRRLMRGRLPDSVLDRPKQGFGIPLNAWLGESLMPLVEDHLNPDSLARTGVFDPRVVGRVLQRHRDGHREGNKLWPILLFQMWHQRWLSK